MNRLLEISLLVVLVLGLSAPGLAETKEKGLHSPDNREACTVCHTKQPDSWEDVEGASPLKRETVHELCTTCHEWSTKRDHPVGRPLVSTPDPKGLLPTDEGSLMDCLTCHKPHGSGPHKAMLRMEPRKLCQACHADK